MTKEKQLLVIVVAGIYDQIKKKWLLIQRERGDYIGKWALVGGKMKFGERIKEALFREISEETNLRVSWNKQNAIINERLIEQRTNKQIKQFLIFLAKTTVESGELKETDEGKLSWFSEEELIERKEEIIPSDFFMLTEILIPDKEFAEVIEVDMFQDGEKLSIKTINNRKDQG